MVKIRGAPERKIRVLLDPGSQRSFIKRDVAQCMRYRPTGVEELIHGLFGERKQDHAVISAIRSTCKVSIISTLVILKHSMTKRHVLLSLSSNQVHGFPS